MLRRVYAAALPLRALLRGGRAAVCHGCGTNFTDAVSEQRYIAWRNYFWQGKRIINDSAMIWTG